MENVLVKTNEYDGKYVALKSFEDHTVVGVGDDPAAALLDAKSKGFDDPVLLFVPDKDIPQIL